MPYSKMTDSCIKLRNHDKDVISMPSLSSYWMVHRSNNNGHGPIMKHSTLESAKAEAERIARLHPGEKIDVLEAVYSCTKSDVVWADLRDPARDPF